jgi:hypothetical protein
MTPVTDPSILAQLNAPVPVTDPDILAQLNGDSAPSFMDRATNDVTNRLASVAQKPSIGHIIGQGYGAVGDVIGEGIKSATPQPVKAAITSGAQGTADAIDSTTTGQKLGDMLMAGRDVASNVAANHPDLWGALSDIGNVASFAGGAKTVGAVEGAGARLGLGDALYNSGKASQDAAHQQFVSDLILPKQTPAVKADMAARMKQTNGTNIYQPTPHEQQVAATVAGIPGVGSGNSLVKNLNLIQGANRQEAEALKARLAQNDVPIPDDVIQNTLMQTHQNIANNPYISGVDATKAASNVVNKALDIITSKPQTASSMLDARKELDAWVASQKGDKAFNPALDSPITTAVQQVRQAMNGMVADAVPSADVRASLQKQSHLYHAAENIAPKAAGEAATRLGRALQTVTPHGLAGKIGAGAGLAALIEAAPHIPMSLAVPSGASFLAYKGATAPATRIALGKALGVSNNVP